MKLEASRDKRVNSVKVMFTTVLTLWPWNWTFKYL